MSHLHVGRKPVASLRSILAFLLFPQGIHFQDTSSGSSSLESVFHLPFLHPKSLIRRSEALKNPLLNLTIRTQPQRREDQ